MRQRIRVFGALTIGLALIALAMFAGCAKDDALAPAPLDGSSVIPQAPTPDAMHDLEALAAQPDRGLAQLTGHRTTVRLPAGSVDGLAGAIAAAGPGGVVIVRTGMHTESDAVVISQSVSILGEPGAVLQLKCDADPADFLMDPGLHVLNATDVTIWGLDLRPADPIGGVCILVQDSPRVLIGFNSMTSFQNSVLLHHTDFARIWGNTVTASDGWLTGDISEADCIIAMNGKHVFVRGNTTQGGLFGLFASGESGQATGNTFTGNLIGMILCKVPEALQLPNGQVVGSEISATGWLVTGNTSTANYDAGYLVIDGANHNWVVSNAASDNGTFDFDLAGDSERFGFFTPTCHDNIFAAGPYQNVTVKDCGENDQVFGGIAIDTTENPCY